MRSRNDLSTDREVLSMEEYLIKRQMIKEGEAKGHKQNDFSERSAWIAADLDL